MKQEPLGDKGYLRNGEQLSADGATHQMVRVTAGLTSTPRLWVVAAVYSLTLPVFKGPHVSVRGM